jgi:hypothetical protein
MGIKILTMNLKNKVNIAIYCNAALLIWYWKYLYKIKNEISFTSTICSVRQQF